MALFEPLIEFNPSFSSYFYSIFCSFLEKKWNLTKCWKKWRVELYQRSKKGQPILMIKEKPSHIWNLVTSIKVSYHVSIYKIRPILYPWDGNSDTNIVTGIVRCIILFLIHHSTGKQTWPQHIVYNFWFGFHRICFWKHLKNNLFLKARIFS